MAGSSRSLKHLAISRKALLVEFQFGRSRSVPIPMADAPTRSAVVFPTFALPKRLTPKFCSPETFTKGAANVAAGRKTSTGLSAGQAERHAAAIAPACPWTSVRRPVGR